MGMNSVNLSRVFRLVVLEILMVKIWLYQLGLYFMCINVMNLLWCEVVDRFSDVYNNMVVGSVISLIILIYMVCDDILELLILVKLKVFSLW